jgi:hypothetical protein
MMLLRALVLGLAVLHARFPRDLAATEVPAGIARRPVPSKVLPAAHAPQAAKLYPNTRPNELLADLKAAADAHVTPVRITGPESIAALGGEGKIFKWVITERNELVGIRTIQPGDLIKHSVAAGGNPVYAAGEARFQNGVLLVNYHSGHYRPELASLNLAGLRFASVGFKVKRIESNQRLDTADPPHE